MGYSSFLESNQNQKRNLGFAHIFIPTQNDRSEFKFYEKRMELGNDTDEPLRVASEMGEHGEILPGDLRFSRGSIDVSDGTPADLGKVNLPVGFKHYLETVEAHAK